MDIKSQIRKYKIQKNELLELWNTGKLREINIHQAEMDRIAIKTQDFKDECQQQAELIRAEQIGKLEKLTEYQKELQKISDKLAEINSNKFKLRAYSLAQIHADNQVKKDIKRNREIYLKQLNNIQQEISKYQGICNKQSDTRRQINEDFYNWRNECNETREKMVELNTDDRKYKILADYLNELNVDERRHPETRLADLDAKCRQAEQQIQQLSYQYNKLQTYMATFGNTVGQTQIVMSTYLKDAAEQIPMLKSKQRELAEIIQSYQTIINEHDVKIAELGQKDLPPELNEQTQRAKDRLRISHNRLDNEYEPLVHNLQTKISVLEQQLLLEPTNSELTRSNTTMVEEHAINTADSNVPTAQDTGGQSNAIILNIGNQLDFTGKSRKEIERLKKEMTRQSAGIQ
jgi:K+/H+ antiporter YhaU regulatory subunit KhtT